MSRRSYPPFALCALVAFGIGLMVFGACLMVNDADSLLRVDKRTPQAEYSLRMTSPHGEGSLLVNRTRDFYIEYYTPDLRPLSRPALNVIVQNGSEQGSGFGDLGVMDMGSMNDRMDAIPFGLELPLGIKTCPEGMRCGFLRVRSNGRPGTMKIRLTVFRTVYAVSPDLVFTRSIRVVL